MQIAFTPEVAQILLIAGRRKALPLDSLFSACHSLSIAVESCVFAKLVRSLTPDIPPNIFVCDHYESARCVFPFVNPVCSSLDNTTTIAGCLFLSAFSRNRSLFRASRGHRADSRVQQAPLEILVLVDEALRADPRQMFTVMKKWLVLLFVFWTAFFVVVCICAAFPNGQDRQEDR